MNRGAAGGVTPADQAAPLREEVVLASRAAGAGVLRTGLSVPGIRCGGCVRTIERALGRLEGVVEARVNLTTRRVSIRWRESGGPPPFIAALTELGYRPHLDAPAAADEADETLSSLTRALAVAGFAAGNVMLLSVAVWSGAEPQARSAFHWLSALIAIPTLAYSGRVFFDSAWTALRRGQTNMDVPISVGVLLAFGMSLYDTMHHGEHAYFDASVMLLFFLLIGRTLDHLMREKARSAVKGLARLAPRVATVERHGTQERLPVEDVAPGMIVVLEAGDRVPVDARVVDGASDLDCSLVSGESTPRAAMPGMELQAGIMNLTGPLRLEATANADSSFLAEMIRLMETAETGRARYRRIADRASQFYAPVVHTAAILTFLGWMAAVGDVHQAIAVAVAVLIITCPCALGLAVPMVQVVASRCLFAHGIIVRHGAALERLGEIDTVVFDKTGTLTLGRTILRDKDRLDPDELAVAAGLAAHSRHPHSRALVAAHAGPGRAEAPLDTVTEHPGCGVEAVSGSDVLRLGRPEWALADGEMWEAETGYSRAILTRNGRLAAVYTFDDPLRPGAGELIADLARRRIGVEILSGDHQRPVETLGRLLGVQRVSAGVRPADKAQRLSALAAAGRRVLMVGDGLNDAPALGMAHVSMAPASAADVGRNAADFVFLRDDLRAVSLALDISRRARRLVQQNFALAILYNAIALPFAVLGMVTPLVAALAMSSSSLLVVANALRLYRSMPMEGRAPERERDTGLATPPTLKAA